MQQRHHSGPSNTITQTRTTDSMWGIVRDAYTAGDQTGEASSCREKEAPAFVLPRLGLPVDDPLTASMHDGLFASKVCCPAA